MYRTCSWNREGEITRAVEIESEITRELEYKGVNLHVQLK